MTKRTSTQPPLITEEARQVAQGFGMDPAEVQKDIDNTSYATPEPLEGVIIPPDGGPSELVLLKRDPMAIFTDEAFMAALLDCIRTRAQDFEADVTTDKGRKKIASQAYRAAQTKTYIDTIGKDLVADLKDLPRKVDNGRKFLRDGIDSIRDDTRKPLDDWEAEQKRCQEVILYIQGLPATLAMSTAGQIQEQITALAGMTWETVPDAAEAKQSALDSMAAILGRRQTFEAEQAELVRLREQQAARERADREEQIRRDAAEKGRRDAEAAANAQLEAAKRKEAEAKLAKEKAQRDKEDAERRLEQQRKDSEAAAERARLESTAREERAREQAKAAEQQRQADEQRRLKQEQEARERNKANRARVLNESLDDCKAIILGPSNADPTLAVETAKAILMAIATGKIRHTHIDF